MTISHNVAEHLEQLIWDGDYQPGHKIPSERQLTDRLGVSRTLVREALKELQGRGIIETHHGKGSFVASVITEVAQDSVLTRLFQDHSRTLYDLLEVREQMEGQAAKLAAERGTNKDFFRITKAFNAMEEGYSTSNAHLDYAFHLAIAEASHNPVLIHLLNSIKSVTLESVKASVDNLSHREEFKQQMDKHHRQIYNAITSRHPQWAQKAAMAHIRHVRQSLREIEKNEDGIIRNTPENL